MRKRLSSFGAYGLLRGVSPSWLITVVEHIDRMNDMSLLIRKWKTHSLVIAMIATLAEDDIDNSATFVN